MIKKYPSIRFPSEAKEGFIRKQSTITDMLKSVTRRAKIKNPPMTEVLRFYAQKPIFIYEDEVANFFLKKKRMRRSQVVI